METLGDGHRRSTLRSHIEPVPASAFKRIGTMIAAIGIFVGINALIVAGGGMMGAGADGLLTPGYSQTRSWFVLIFGILAWLALALIVIVLVRRAKRLHPSEARSLSAEFTRSDLLQPPPLGRGSSNG